MRGRNLRSYRNRRRGRRYLGCWYDRDSLFLKSLGTLLRKLLAALLFFLLDLPPKAFYGRGPDMPVAPTPFAPQLPPPAQLPYVAGFIAKNLTRHCGGNTF